MSQLLCRDNAMREVGIFEAKNGLGRLLDDAACLELARRRSPPLTSRAESHARGASVLGAAA